MDSHPLTGGEGVAACLCGELSEVSGILGGSRQVRTQVGAVDPLLRLEVLAMRHLAYVNRDHQGCIICAQVVRQRKELHAQNLVKLRRVAASLRALSADPRQGGTKQETPGPASPEVSTAPNLLTQIRRAAGAQYDGRD